MKFPALRFFTVLGLAAGCGLSLPAQSVSIHLSDNFTQTGSSAPTEIANPFSFAVHLRRGTPTIDMSNWGPAFYLPGTGGTPGSPNFPGSPNNHGVDFLFEESFATSGALLSAYPTGSYGVVFTGGSAPAPGLFTAGLSFTGGGFAGAAPQVVGTELSNGASWSGGLLVRDSGTTLLDINTAAFTEYGSGDGTFAGASLYDASGNVLASINSFFIPSLSLSDSLFSQFAINGGLLTEGSSYTLDIQYGILASAPASASLGGNTFDGTAAYYMTTRISLTAIPEPSTYAMMAGLLALGCLALRRRLILARAE